MRVRVCVSDSEKAYVRFQFYSDTEKPVCGFSAGLFGSSAGSGVKSILVYLVSFLRNCKLCIGNGPCLEKPSAVKSLLLPTAFTGCKYESSWHTIM